MQAAISPVQIVTSQEAPGRRYVVNPQLEVGPMGRGRFELRIALWGARVDATTYQLDLLQQFGSWARPADVLSRYPFEREASEGFIETCIAQGVLLERGSDGQPVLPVRTRPAATMFNAPRFERAEPPAFAFLGVPWDAGTTAHPGARFGPTAVRMGAECRYAVDPETHQPRGFYSLSAGRSLCEGVTFADAGDVFMPPNLSPDVAQERVTDAVRELLDAGSIPIVIGGDHSISAPILRAYGEGRFGIIHLDAHTDLGTPLPGVGLDHGNVFSVVLDELPNVERLVQVGMRGVVEGARPTPVEDVFTFGMGQFRRWGVEPILRALPEDIPYYLSIDIDVVDPSFAPATGTPVPGGMYPHELEDLVAKLASSRSLIGCDIVEVAHPTGTGDQTAGLAAECVLNIADGIVRYAASAL